ncbi:MAG TPA: phosphoribosylformylglycinamidine synthase subunit PurS [Acidimicrobiia bacterium]|nr:phosphoribosylformylglycinamidine synthase subunit PurS [Acidimicrobiia bacterium]
MRVTVHVRRRPEIADPHGATVARSLEDLGHHGVTSVRIDRTIHLEVDGTDPAEVRERIAAMCDQLLVNPVLEDYEIVVGS